MQQDEEKTKQKKKEDHDAKCREQFKSDLVPTAAESLQGGLQLFKSDTVEERDDFRELES